MPGFDLSKYTFVQDHINRFWSEYPDGRIHTELMSLPDEFDRVVFKAEIFRRYEDVEPSSTGWAAETSTPDIKGVNQTSWHENCETSAIGRALVNMGYAKTAAERPSREETDKVNRHRERTGETARERIEPERWFHDPGQDAAPLTGPLISERQVGYIRALMGEKGVTDEVMHTTILVDYDQEHLKDLTKQQASHYIGRLQAMNNVAQQGVTQEPQKGHERTQQGYDVPQEPAWIGADRWTN